MIRNDVKVRQIATFFIAFMPLCKLVSTPAVFAGFCGEKLWQPLIILFAADLGLVALFLFISAKRERTAFFDILKQEYSDGFARVIFFVYAVFFVLKAFIPFCEYKYLIETGFYEVMPSSDVLFPVFLVTLFLSVKGLKVFARCSEFLSFITCAGLALLFFLSVGSGDFANLLPLFYGDKSGVLNCALKNVFWFNDAVYMVLFCGHFECEKKMNVKITLAYVASALAVIFFFVCFYSVFYTVSPVQKSALSSISIFSVTLVNVGRFDFLALFMLLISALFSLAFPLFAATKCLRRVFDTDQTLWFGLAANGIIFLAVFFLAGKLEGITEFYQTYLYPFFWICGYAIPLLGLKGCFLKKSTNEKPLKKGRTRLKESKNRNELQTG